MTSDSKLVKNYIACTPTEESLYYVSEEYQKAQRYLNQSFKAEVSDVPVKFPKELGSEHPFEFEAIEKTYKKYGLVAAAVNKYADAVVGDFTVKLDNPNAQALVDDFIHDTNFLTVMRTWVREGVLKGSGFMEIDLKDKRIRDLNANNIYVKRDKQGKVIEYNQFLGKLKHFSRDRNKVITFKPDQIAHLPINLIPGEPYGIGYIYPAEKIIENLLCGEAGAHKLISRKAGAPIHVKLGAPGESVQSGDIEEFKKKLQFMNNSTEWVTDGNVEMNVLDFGDIGKNYGQMLEHDFDQFAAAVEVPVVFLGRANIPEGLAKAQGDSWKSKIKAIQEQVADIVEEKIIRPLLKSEGLDEQPDFIWNNPSDESINERVLRIKELLGIPTLSPEMVASLEIELARLLELENIEEILIQPKDARAAKEEEEKKNMEREQEENIPQPEVPGAKQNANQEAKGLMENEYVKIKEEVRKKNSGEMTLQEFVNLKELPGFNYSDYLVRILKNLRTDKFEMILAKTEQDIVDGLIPKEGIDKLRTILRNGFKGNKTIREIEKEIRESVPLKDRIVSGKIVAKAEARPNSIARTETVRVANEGLVDIYKENKIEKVRFLAALSDRTCPQCESLNGLVFPINELNVGESQPPIHTNCRCSLISIVE